MNKPLALEILESQAFPDDKRKMPSSRLYTRENMNIYVGNLSYEMTEENLRQLFAEYGTVTSVNVIRDRDTGNSKGFGFVEMERQADGEKAVKELNGNIVKDREIKVNQARPREDRSKSRQRNW